MSTDYYLLTRGVSLLQMLQALPELGLKLESTSPENHQLGSPHACVLV
jgi:hypothetical protein